VSRPVTIGIIAAVVTVVLAILFGKEVWTTLSNMESDGGLDARTATVQEGALKESVSAPGFVEPVSKVEISAQISARIVGLPFREGDAVQKGDLLVQLDDRNLKAQLASTTARRDGERARLEAERARSEGPRQSLENAVRVLERQKRLFETGDVARQALDDAEVRVDELQASVAATGKTIGALESSLAASEAEIERVREEVAYATIRAPIAGTITRLNAEVGELVVVGTMNNAGTVIMTVADLGRMRVRVQVAEADIAKVQDGQPTDIHINAFPDKVFSGVVEEVALQRTSTGTLASPTQTAGTFEVDVSLNTDGMRIYSGLAANVDITIKEHRGLVVPTQAIVERKRDELPEELVDSPLFTAGQRVVPIVFREVNGVVHPTAVKLGASSLTETLVEAGLDIGQSVVTGPYKTLEKLKNGETIRRDSVTIGGPGGSRGRHGRSGMSVRVGM
jgi:HlyD family secretion protein